MSFTLPLPLATSVWDVLRRSGLFIECYSRNTIYRLHPELSPFLSGPGAHKQQEVIRDDDGFEQRFIDDDPERMEAEGVPHAYKLAAFSRDPERLSDIRRALEPLELTFTSSFPFNLEIMERGRGKGRCIAFLCDWLHITREQVMAFGDNTNDAEMLAASGVPVAMGNAEESLRQIARIVAPTNRENGEAQIIYHYVLGR